MNLTVTHTPRRQMVSIRRDPDPRKKINELKLKIKRQRLIIKRQKIEQKIKEIEEVL